MSFALRKVVVTFGHERVTTGVLHSPHTLARLYRVNFSLWKGPPLICFFRLFVCFVLFFIVEIYIFVNLCRCDEHYSACRCLNHSTTCHDIHCTAGWALVRASESSSGGRTPYFQG